MPRNIVICCDGTNNEFGPRNTNVVRLIQAIDRDPRVQHVYYDPGLGTLPEPGVWSSAGKKVSVIFGLAFGAGLSWKVGEAYTYLMNHWEPGDRVFLFGFSRGAYSVRVLAGLLHQLGLLPRGSQNLVPYVMRLFRGVRGRDEGSRYWKLCEQFRWTFSRQVSGRGDDRRFPVHFLGVWDTVSSVGWVWDPTSYPFTAHNPGIGVVRHAVSIDERRAFFKQNLMQKSGTQDLVEAWFPGVHCDVGGGYEETPEEGGLYSLPFEWILGEAKRSGLRIDGKQLKTTLGSIPRTSRPWTDRQHESLSAAWWPAEFFPKLSWRHGLPFRVPQWNLGRHRPIAEGSLIHRSTLLRIRDTSYAPPNLPEAFLKRVRSLRKVPDILQCTGGDPGSISSTRASSKRDSRLP